MGFIFRTTSVKDLGLFTVSLLMTVGLASANILLAVVAGAFTIFFGYRSINPKIKKVDFESPEYQERKKEFEKQLIDDGVFTYNDSGFNLRIKDVSHDIKWTDIRTMFGYKRDDMTADTICLDVFCDNEVGFRITENMPGWYKFLAKSKESFPQIEKNWDAKIAFPSFKTNLTVVYDYQGRSLKQVENIYYQDK